MANQIGGGKPKDISPRTLDPTNANANDVGANFDEAEWASAWYACEGTPNHGPKQSTQELNVKFGYAFGGAAAIEILPQLAGPDRANPAAAGYRDSAGDAQRDVVSLAPANLVDDPGFVDLAFNIKGASHIRFLARGLGGGAPTMTAEVTAG